MTTSSRTSFRPLLAALLGLALLACGSEQPVDDTPATAEVAGASATPTHATDEAVPGSYEDWCGEHAVPESLCTRCNPDLIPAFRATGDWCEEHGLPESQCLLCNPGLRIERPPQPGTAAP